MTILLDFLPILFFFASFKYAEQNRSWASHFATDQLGAMVSGGLVNEQDAPMILATLVVMIATAVQVGILLLRRKKVSSMLLISLGLVTLLGGATIWFHDKRLIMWKPTVLYWAMGVVFLLRARFSGTTMMEAMVGEALKLPDFAWRRLNASWIAFFGAMGVVNLYVAYSFSTETWVSFKLFGGLGLMLTFVAVQAVYMDRHAKAALDSAANAVRDA